ncbi:MAG: ABC transporter ATP-binding protein [Candidatus Hydrogenedentes bacterium]|nr:ABC transporter ATP-binding protein [Candidatus Hydrogenedentota bacterium]
MLRNVGFSLNPGACAAIVGPSGCGKSTLLNLMGALDTPTSGRVLFRGNDLAGLKPRELARFRNREAGFVFQSHHLLPQCTALENVLVPTLVHNGANGARERAMKLLDRVGLSHRMDARPEALSGGERQRAAFVRALINRPALLLADEPTGSLNEEAARQLADLMIELQREESMAVVVVTHALAIAERFGRVLELRDGRLVPRGGGNKQRQQLERQ